MKLKTACLNITLLAPMLLAAPAQAMDVDTYLGVAEETIKKVKKGKVKDVDKLIAQQEELIRLGIEGALKFAEESPENRKMMHLLVLNSERMKSMSLDDIEKMWHGGEYMKSHGIDINEMGHTDAAMNFYDAIVHPATAFIALTEYKSSKEAELLEQVENELTEVMMHVEHLKPEGEVKKKK
jgi:hypothetical protein